MCQPCMRLLIEGMEERKQMVEYRKSIDLDANTEYWFAELGVLNFLNGGSSWPFTSEDAARKFAIAHKRIAKTIHGIDREVWLRFPDGTKEDIKDV